MSNEHPSRPHCPPAAYMAGLAPSHSPSPKASLDDKVDDDKDDADSSGDDKMTTF